MGATIGLNICLAFVENDTEKEEYLFNENPIFIENSSDIEIEVLLWYVLSLSLYFALRLTHPLAPLTRALGDDPWRRISKGGRLLGKSFYVLRKWWRSYLKQSANLVELWEK